MSVIMLIVCGEITGCKYAAALARNARFWALCLVNSITAST